eukprot:GHVU01077405.1.p2 GENE.GHVU01077405.1~~GHVU01077405.1.p2  ORF type:complete len:173 (+),score=30.71 GHVU01077405.1:63-521(+)
MTERERTFVMIKPDGVHRSLIGKIVARFEQRGYLLVGMKMLQPSKQLLEQHYAELKTKPFFAGLVKYVGSGPVIAMVWEGTDVVKQSRSLIGETDPKKSAPGTIRGDFGIDVGRNVIHGSDAPETAKREIALWFKTEELCMYKSCQEPWIYE